MFDPSGFTFENPGPDEIVVVRAAMAYPIFVNFIPSQGHRLTGNQRLINGFDCLPQRTVHELTRTRSR